jgi:hypothetical protein
MDTDTAPIAFVVEHPDAPTFEIRVNFGIFAGREATPAEIDDLARRLLFEVDAIEIVSEQIYEVAPGSEAQLHQVRIAVSDPLVDSAKIVSAAEQWAHACIDNRHAEISES